MLRGRPFGRRHGPFVEPMLSPSAITSATKRFWHDAQDTATYSGGTWSDKFGNGYDVAQASAPNRPTVATDAFGGRSSLRFTAASSQELAFSHATKITDFMGGDDVAFELWMVLQLNSVTGGHVIFDCDSTVSASIYSLTETSGAAWYYQRNEGTLDRTQAQTGAAPATATPYVLRASYTGTDASWTVNGVTLTTAGTSNTGIMAVDRMIYGAYGNGGGAHNTFLDGWLGESFGLTGTLSTSEARGVTNFLKAKWGVVF